MITLTQKEVDELKNFANEIPTKYGFPLLQFLSNKEEEVDKKDVKRKGDK
tara:strand:+ start:4457 stop:4606 length:150 start_codon:yes stop_codon:yes gene_type:complete